MDQGQAAPPAQPQGQGAPQAQPGAAAAPPVLPAPPLPPPPVVPAAPSPPAFALGPGRSHAVINFDDPTTGSTATKLYNKAIAPVENSNTRLLLISCSQGILSFSSFSCYLLLRLLVYMYLSQLMRTFTNYLKCIIISS